MLSLFMSVCALAPVLGARVVKIRDTSSYVVVCTYEHWEALLNNPEAGKAEFGECTARDGTVYGVDPEQLEWAESEDVLSLTIRAAYGMTVTGARKYTVVSAKLVHRDEPNVSMMRNDY